MEDALGATRVEKQEQGDVPTIERVMEAFARDERSGRPGPRPPRLNAEVGWRELVRIVVQTRVSEGPDGNSAEPAAESFSDSGRADG